MTVAVWLRLGVDVAQTPLPSRSTKAVSVSVPTFAPGQRDRPPSRRRRWSPRRSPGWRPRSCSARRGPASGLPSSVRAVTLHDSPSAPAVCVRRPRRPGRERLVRAEVPRADDGRRTGQAPAFAMFHCAPTPRRPPGGGSTESAVSLNRLRRDCVLSPRCWIVLRAPPPGSGSTELISNEAVGAAARAPRARAPTSARRARARRKPVARCRCRQDEVADVEQRGTSTPAVVATASHRVGHRDVVRAVDVLHGLA